MRLAHTVRGRLSLLLTGIMVFGSVIAVHAEWPGKKRIYLKKYTPLNSAVKSALLPGWGQYVNRQKGKAYTIAAAEVVAVSTAYILFNTAQDKYDDYKEKGQKDDKLFDDYETYLQGSMIAGTAAAGLWLYSIIEAYVFARDEIKRRESDFSLRLRFDGDTAMLAYQKKF